MESPPFMNLSHPPRLAQAYSTGVALSIPRVASLKQINQKLSIDAKEQKALAQEEDNDTGRMLEAVWLERG